MIRKTLGAAFIAGSALTVYNTDAVKPIVDEAIAKASQNIEIPPEISANKDALQIGGGILGLMLGVSMIAGATVRRMKKKHTIHPDVDQELNRKLSILSHSVSDEFDKTRAHDRHSALLVASRLGEVMQSLGKIDQRLAGELSVDISALEKASSEIGNVEGASQRVLEILEKIENSANTHIALNTPDGVLERFTKAQIKYSEAHDNLSRAAKAAMQQSNARVAVYPERFNDMLGAAAQLNIKVQNANGDIQSIADAAHNLTKTVSDHVNHISAQIHNDGSNPGRSAPHFAAVSTAAANIIMSATELVAAQKMLLQVQAPRNNHVPELTQVDEGQDMFKADVANDFETNEDGMIEVAGYGAIPLNPPTPWNNL